MWCFIGYNNKFNAHRSRNTYFVPKLRDLLWPGMNLLFAVTACNLKEPDEALAGDRLSEAIAVASVMIDSLELQLEELGGGETGSSLRDNLENITRILFADQCFNETTTCANMHKI